MASLKLGAGLVLVAVSLLAVVQSVRELLLWAEGDRHYAERSFLERPFEFGGRVYTVTDDQPVAAVNDEVGYEGTIQIQMDDEPLGSPSRALVRRGRTDLGRYHLWFDAWVFKDRRTGAESLWITRRIQEQNSRPPVFETIRVEEDGTFQIRRYRTYQLGSSYPLFRATQFVRDGTSSAVPLSLLEAFYFWPVLLVFPVGTFGLGIYLVRRSRRERRARQAA